MDKKKVVCFMCYEIGKDEILCFNFVYFVLVDKEGLIWVGFYQLGLDYILYQSGLFFIYMYVFFFDFRDMLVCVFVIKEKEKLIGFCDGFFYIDEENYCYKSFKVLQLCLNMIFSCLYYQNEYYIGIYGGGMYVLNFVILIFRDFELDGGMFFSKGYIFCIKQDCEKNLWIGIFLGIFCYKDGRQIVYYISVNFKLLEGNVYEIYFDFIYKGWICIENGMCIWDFFVWILKIDVFFEGFIYKEKIRVIYEDFNYDFYFFLDKGFFFIFDLFMIIFRCLQLGIFLDGNDGMFIVEDCEKWLWLGINNGLFWYDKKDYFIFYNFVDGIFSFIFIFCLLVCDENGIWFGNFKGFLYLDIVWMNQRKFVFYLVVIIDICVNGKFVV